MKKIIIILTLVFSAHTSSALIAFDESSFVNYVKMEVHHVERSSPSDANLLINGFQSVDGDENTQEEVQLVLRDKLGIIEPFIQKGHVLSFTTPYSNTSSPFFVTEANPADLVIRDSSGKEIAHTLNFSTVRRGESFFKSIGETHIIFSQNGIVDCMPNTRKKVCHPELMLNIFHEGTVAEQLLARGDVLDLELSHIESVHLTDTHIYKQHKKDERDYLRAQFFVVVEDSANLPHDSSYFYTQLDFFENPHCRVGFSDLGVLQKTCGLRGHLYNLTKYIQEKIKPEPDYGIIAC